MTEWIIFNTPPVLLIFVGAIGCSLFERFTRSTRGVLTYVSAVLALLSVAILLVCGGSMWEGCALLLLYFVINREESK